MQEPRRLAAACLSYRRRLLLQCVARTRRLLQRRGCPRQRSQRHNAPGARRQAAHDTRAAWAACLWGDQQSGACVARQSISRAGHTGGSAGWGGGRGQLSMLLMWHSLGHRWGMREVVRPRRSQHCHHSTSLHSAIPICHCMPIAPPGCVLMPSLQP